jgi:hypothetical protein
MIDAPLLLWTISFLPPALLCDGRPVGYPGDLRFAIDYEVRAMVAYTDGGCLADPEGHAQACAVRLSRGTWDLGQETHGVLEDFLYPPPGAVFLFGDPVACNDFGCSRECATP